MSGFRFINSNDLVEFQRRMREHPMDDNRLVGIKFDTIRGNQYKRIVSDYSKQYKLLASEYFGKEFNLDSAK